MLLVSHYDAAPMMEAVPLRSAYKIVVWEATMPTMPVTQAATPLKNNGRMRAWLMTAWDDLKWGFGNREEPVTPPMLLENNDRIVAELKDAVADLKLVLENQAAHVTDLRVHVADLKVCATDLNVRAHDLKESLALAKAKFRPVGAKVAVHDSGATCQP